MPDFLVALLTSDDPTEASRKLALVARVDQWEADLIASLTIATQRAEHAGADLKRALEAQGVAVAGLDIGVAGDQARQRAHQRDADAAHGRNVASAERDEELSPIDPDHPTTTAPTIALGALVDVLA
jgi:hypothetical protein